MRYIAIILFLFLIACANVRRPERGAILNPGDPTQVWIVDDIHHFATPAITDPNADGCMEGNGKTSIWTAPRPLRYGCTSFAICATWHGTTLG